MPFNGTGIFERIYSWQVDAANDLNVDSERMDRDTDDIADGLSNCITRDGQSPALANLPMGGFKFTGLGNGTTPTDSVNYGQVFNSPTFSNASAATLPSLSGPPLRFATIQNVLDASYSAVLPGQPGGTIRYDLTSLNGSASWQISSVMQNPEKLAEAMAIALYF